MRRKPVRQLRLLFDGQGLWETFPEKVKGRCKELMFGLLAKVMEGESRREAGADGKENRNELS